jgi:hypothetical protein
VRALSLAFDIIFLFSLAILILPIDEFAVVPITLALIGIIVQGLLLQRFRLSQRRQMAHSSHGFQSNYVERDENLRVYCNRAISVDAKICRFCLTEVDEHHAATQVSSQTGIADLQLQGERWFSH